MVIVPTFLLLPDVLFGHIFLKKNMFTLKIYTVLVRVVRHHNVERFHLDIVAENTYLALNAHSQKEK